MVTLTLRGGDWNTVYSVSLIIPITQSADSTWPGHCLSVCLSVRLSVWPGHCLSVWPGHCLSVCLSVRLSVCLAWSLSAE